MDVRILLILAGAFLVRIWGIAFGLPFLYHADEPNVVNRALAYASGDFNPHYFKIPPLVSYLLAGFYGVYYLVARAVGWLKGTADFEILFFQDPTSFYLLGRVVLGATFGMLAVFCLYRLIRKHFSGERALLASCFLAFNFLHVRDSHYIYLDIPLQLALLLSFFPIFKILERNEWKDYISFGVLLGAAVATKYNGVFIVLPFLAASGIKKKIKFTNLAVAGSVALVSFLILNPFSLLDFKSFWRDFIAMREFLGAQPGTHHFLYSLQGSLGWPLLILSMAGMGRAIFSRNPKSLLFSIFVLSYYLVLCLRSQPYDRYVLPLIPFLCFFSADLLCSLQDRLNWKKSVLWLIAFIVLIPMLTRIYLSNRIFIQPDVRNEARLWVESNVSDGTKVALDTPFFMPRLRPAVYQLEEKHIEIENSNPLDRTRLRKIDRLLEEARRNPEHRYELYFLRDRPNDEFLLAKPSLPYEWEELRKQGIEYVIVSKINEANPPAFFYQALRQKAEQVARFSPYKDSSIDQALDRQPLTGGPFLWKELIARNRNGQIIEVYRLKG